MAGKVYLVGAGPGDPKLITVKGLEVLRKSDAVVYDRLASPRLLEEARPGAEQYYVGKLPERHSMTQEEINGLLVRLAKEGKTVTRLKGGDPCVFGRAGEEAEALLAHGIPFEIVPGVTSAVAVPAYAGIPVTHREYSSSFTVATGHEKPEKLDTMIDWRHLSDAGKTIVFLMGVSRIGHIAEQLMSHGRPPDTPVALVRWGTRAEQETLVGTLATIAEQVREADFQPPAVIVVGEVVRLRERLSWYERLPLFGRRVLITRARAQAGELADRIEALGGEPVEFPVIALKEPDDPEKCAALDAALDRLDRFDWILFTSVNGVEFFFRRMRRRGVDIRAMHRATIAAVGPATREALMKYGLVVEELPQLYQAEGLLEAIRPKVRPGQTVLLPRADIARKTLPEELRRLGCEVTEVDVYENVPCEDGADRIVELLNEGAVDAVTFTSSSTARNFADIIRRRTDRFAELMAPVRIACIGPLTAKTAEECGMRADIVPEQATIDALAQALAERLGPRPSKYDAPGRRYH
jgi:uroporphyrinogen III methyltransferase/synthase